MLHFDSDTYQASFAGAAVQLLPKEFVLLRYLYEHAGRSFSREQLLDAVWPDEAPVDRTVDDHIYRLRKKLAPWRHFVQIETIRGQGYKLIRQAPAQPESPLLKDEQFAADMRRMLARYHGLGMGAAMELLLKHRDTLSLPKDPDYEAYLRFIRGDFEGLLRAGGISHEQKLAYAAFIHASIQMDAKASLRYFESLLAKGKSLTREWRNDLQLSMISLCLEAGWPDRAQEALEAVRPDIAELDSPSFTAIFRIKEMLFRLQIGQTETAAILLRENEGLLERHPMMRERGALLVSKAIFLYRQGQIPPARRALDDGMETTRQTLFVPHLLASLKTILQFLGTHPIDETYRLNYRRQWDQLAATYRFDSLRAHTERLLDQNL
ncbi:winged helix-turn-helix domain-containing protein [Cohnella caldifontis]|uniref:winged helix-turn-helix domain-containing protein n=1 Tax=Cohnella caldifontis TaxID=3027471 RepID=UPI0023EBAB26|nr:winged helix-turn-helix domain-containing protein [Cohnella sp. YIM B05605]